MIPIRLGRLRFWMLMGLIAWGGTLVGCATTPPPTPGPSAAEVTQRLAALEDCILRSQRVVGMAASAGVSGGSLGPSNSALADAQEALEESRRLLQQGKNQEAMDQATQALEDCNKIEAMVKQASDEHRALAEKARMQAEAEARLGRLSPCIESARRAIAAAKSAGATNLELRSAENAAENAEFILKEAQELLNKGEVKPALARLDIAQSDCLTAQDLANQAGVTAANRMQAKPKEYTVTRGDTLWGISGKTPIYANPFMWPLIYKANRNEIRDPDLIHPNQVFAIPRTYSQEEAGTAAQRAKTRGPWRLGDGPDYYILEGVRR